MKHSLVVLSLVLTLLVANGVTQSNAAQEYPKESIVRIVGEYGRLALAVDATPAMQDLLRDELGPPAPELTQQFEEFVASFDGFLVAKLYQGVLKDYFSSEEAGRIADFFEGGAGRSGGLMFNDQLFGRFESRPRAGSANPRANAAYTSFVKTEMGQKWQRHLPELQSDMFLTVTLMASAKMGQLPGLSAQ